MRGLDDITGAIVDAAAPPVGIQGQGTVGLLIQLRPIHPARGGAANHQRAPASPRLRVSQSANAINQLDRPTLLPGVPAAVGLRCPQSPFAIAPVAQRFIRVRFRAEAENVSVGVRDLALA